MKNKDLMKNISDGGIVALIAIAIFILICGLSWITTCGIIKLITLCFGWTFQWGIATGIWLAMFLLRSVFNITVKNS